MRGPRSQALVLLLAAMAAAVLVVAGGRADDAVPRTGDPAGAVEAGPLGRDHDGTAAVIRVARDRAAAPLDVRRSPQAPVLVAVLALLVVAAATDPARWAGPVHATARSAGRGAPVGRRGPPAPLV